MLGHRRVSLTRKCCIKPAELSPQELGLTSKKLETSIAISNARITEIQDKLKLLADKDDVALLREIRSSHERVADRKQRDAEKAALQKEKERETLVLKLSTDIHSFSPSTLRRRLKLGWRRLLSRLETLRRGRSLEPD